ncbi:hypothetical protein ILUMI_25897 [Ignelater luminosus]|uniref:DDE-1 domain-containing protein n=1 Tax=Ignelater luminosus TaxID=2038154 RepID=A0A8K0FZL9_IGNLU|nr:hypothetical protein ILUMI_25897 [Ignelater luminosus]
MGHLPEPCGWLTRVVDQTESLFVQYLECFIKIVKPSRDEGTLLIVDNHKNHLSIEAIKLAKENGITILTFPPHTSYKFQPLDRTANPERPITMYDVSAVVGKAFQPAFTTRIIISGFKISDRPYETPTTDPEIATNLFASDAVGLQTPAAVADASHEDDKVTPEQKSAVLLWTPPKKKSLRWRNENLPRCR